ncbi:MAG: alpha-galactosidase [Deltaproteobacteria bacterium]|nr:alpha-galactosidase [Deltaproteobacteria bacterium]
MAQRREDHTSRHQTHACRVLPLVIVLGCSGAGSPGPTTMEVGGSRLLYHDAGWIEIVRDGGAPIVTRGTAFVMLDSLRPPGPRLATDGDRARSVEHRRESDALGDAERLAVTVHGAAGEPDVVWTISAYASGGFYTFRIDVENVLDGEVRVAKASALEIDAQAGGGLFLGRDPARHRILDNGSMGVFDYVVQVMPGNVLRNDPLARSIPGSFRGQSIANWSHAVTDLDGGGNWVAGALTFERSSPMLNLSAVDELQPTAPDGRRGFNYVSAEAAYLPEPRPVRPGERLESELYYVHPAERDAAAGLEHWAERVAANLGIVPWTRRDGGRRVPNGWNSWSGSGGTGGYGTEIDESVVLDNLDVAATELRDWGLDWFQIDDGYEPAYGDWTWRTDRFPHGAAWLADEIRARGLRPGLWMAPFTPSPDSQLAADHPDWIADWTALGDVIGSDLILDLTHPEVLAYLHETFARFHDEWRFDWLKMDFAYWALLGTGFHDPARTREEAWHGALDAIREELGPDTFFLAVSASGLDYQHADSVRITLDNMPVWDGLPDVPLDDAMSQQGLKPTVRNAGRRWYLQDRIWVNHPDLIFFRSNTEDPTWPPLTFEESQAFCTFVGLSGGIVKLGDRLVDLDADAINVIRTLLPIYGRSARPLDVLTREFPEVWLENVEPLDGYDESYVLVGLFNWGRNVDLSVEPYAEIPDDGAPRWHVVDLDAQGLGGEWLAYEFWGGRYLGRVEGTLTDSVPPHDAHVIALRRPTGAPQFLGWNRQLTMGGVLLEEASWDAGSRTLTLRTPVAAPTATAPFTYEIAVYVPPGFGCTGVDTSGAPVRDVTTATEGEVLRVRFVPEATGELEMVVRF